MSCGRAEVIEFVLTELPEMTGKAEMAAMTGMAKVAEQIDRLPVPDEQPIWEAKGT